MAELSAAGVRLTQELDRLRDLAGMSGRELARRTNISQPMLSRISRGTALPSVPQVRRWLTECGADEETRARVLDLAEIAAGETRPWRSLLAERGHLQDEVRIADAQARRICVFAPTTLPGLLQTAAYARAVLDRGRTTDVPAAVAARMQRQELLHDADRRCEFLVTEQVLSWEPAAGVSGAQLDRIAALSTLDNVEVAVLPSVADIGVLLWHNFVIRHPIDGPPVVAIELQHGAQQVSDPESVAIYEDVWARAWKAAVPWTSWRAS